jgi:hypothetical protein
MPLTVLLTTVSLSLGTPAADKPGSADKVFAAGNLQASEEVDITGTYFCKGENALGNAYHGSVKIEKSRDAYNLTWKFDGKVNSVGVGIRKGRFLSVSSLSRSSDGVSLIVVVYEIQAGPRLEGRFTEYGGKGVLRSETLTIIKLPE